MSLATGRLAPELVALPAALVSLMAVGVLVAGLVGAVRRPRDAGPVFERHAAFALQLLLAAGLIRLAALDSLRAFATVAAIIAIRQVIARGVRLGAATPPRAGRGRAT